MLRTWKLTLEYDGTQYSGWQEQKNARTVAGDVRQAAQDFLQTDVELHGSGKRTRASMPSPKLRTCAPTSRMLLDRKNCGAP